MKIFYLLKYWAGLCICLPVCAQAQHIQWQHALGGTINEYCNSIAQARDSGYIICGGTTSVNGDITSPSHGGQDLWVVKLKNSGGIEWQKKFGGAYDEYGSSVKATRDGGYIIAGYSKSGNGDVAANRGGNDWWVIKLDGSGNIVWEKTYGGSGDDRALAVQQTYDNGYIVAGTTQSADGDITGFHGGGNPDCWLIKLDDTGRLEWQKAYGGTGDDEAVAIQQTPDTGYIFTGLTMSANGDVSHYHGGTSEGGDCWVVKTDKTGNLVWEKTYGGRFEDQGFALLQKPNGHYIIGASTMSDNDDVTDPLGQADAWILELNDTGGIVWQKTYGTSGSEYLTDIRITADKGYVFCGWNSNAWIAKTDSAGNLQWQNSFGGSNDDEMWAMDLAHDQGFVMAGFTTSSDGDVSGFQGGYEDIWVLKVSDPAGVPVADMAGGSLHIYPNPAEKILHIDGITEQVSATLYNMLGQQAGKWQLAAGASQIPLGDIAAGTYQLQLRDKDGHIQYAQVVKVR